MLFILTNKEQNRNQERDSKDGIHSAAIPKGWMLFVLTTPPPLPSRHPHGGIMPSEINLN